MNIIKEIPYNPNWVKRSVTQNIILHHTDSLTASIQDIDEWHKSNGWENVGYQFLVRKNGKIYEGRPFDIQGAHTLNGYNNNSIGICFEGSFETEHMDEPQRSAGVELIRYIQMRYNYTLKIYRHLDVQSNTQCPGINFPNSIIYEGMKGGIKMSRDEALKIIFDAGCINTEEYWQKACDVCNHFDTLLVNVATKIQELKNK